MATTTCPLAVFVLAAVLAGGCGQRQSAATPADSSATSGTGSGAALSAEQLRDGIGPVQQVAVGPTIDHQLAEQGEQIFTTKCSACHRLDKRYVGPALGEVTKRRTPTYVMNMILNPTEMTARHPVAHQLLATLMTQMPNLGLTQAEARAVLEYLRKAEQPEMDKPTT